LIVATAAAGGLCVPVLWRRGPVW